MKKNNKKLNIGLFNDSFYPMMDGVISVVDNYAKELSKYANVYVFVPKTPGINYDDSKLSYKVIRCKSIKMHIIDYSCPIPKFDKNFKKELEQYDLDIVHIHSPFFIGKHGIKYAKKHNIPVIGHMHSQFKLDLKRALKMEFLTNFLNKHIIINTFNNCDECWAVGDETARMFYEDYGYKTLPKVMENATDMTPIKNPDKSKIRINTMHNIKENEKVFLFVGRINELKNIMLIAESIKILKELKPKFKFKMLFVGDGSDEKDLKQYINDNNLNDVIIMCGRVMDRELLSDYYNRSDLFIFPSLYDTSAIVRIEAASQKTPGIFLKGSATATTIKENINGYITENDANKLASKIINIMKNEKEYKKVTENAFKDLYVTWNTKVKEAYKLYCDLIEKKQKESN